MNSQSHIAVEQDTGCLVLRTGASGLKSFFTASQLSPPPTHTASILNSTNSDSVMFNIIWVYFLCSWEALGINFVHLLVYYMYKGDTKFTIYVLCSCSPEIYQCTTRVTHSKILCTVVPSLSVFFGVFLCPCLVTAGLINITITTTDELLLWNSLCSGLLTVHVSV